MRWLDQVDLDNPTRRDAKHHIHPQHAEGHPPPPPPLPGPVPQRKG